MMKARILWGCILMLLSGVTVSAEERTVALRDIAVIQDGRGSARAVFRLGALPFTDKTVIERAILRVPYNETSNPQALELRICPVTASWTEATWSLEYDVELYASAQVEALEAAGVAVFDLALPLKAVLESGLSADGFVVVGRSEGDDLRSADVSRLDLAGAELDVTTTVVPSGFPPRARTRQS